MNADEFFIYLKQQVIDMNLSANSIIDISTYGMYLDISKGKDWSEVYGKSKAREFIDVVNKTSNISRLLIGLPYFMSCKVDCKDCIDNYNTRLDRVTETIDIIGLVNVKVNPASHLKYYRLDDRIFIGGINLSQSSYVDCAVEITDREAKIKLAKEFRNHWDNSFNDIIPFKK